MVTFWGVLLVLGFLAVARYGADTRSGADPTGRDPAWPVTRRPHTVRGDAVLIAELAHRAAAHGRLWEAYDRSLRPWETEQRQTTVVRGDVPTPRESQASARRATASSRASGERV
jgi:hypothetical protein